jgi:hypothetical protein
MGTYTPRAADATVLHGVVRDHLDDFLAAAAARTDGTGLPPFIERQFRGFVRCGLLVHGFLRLRCDDCAFERLIPYFVQGEGGVPQLWGAANGRACGESRRGGVPYRPRPAVGAHRPASAALPARLRPRPLPRRPRGLRARGLGRLPWGRRASPQGTPGGRTSRDPRSEKFLEDRVPGFELGVGEVWSCAPQLGLDRVE